MLPLIITDKDGKSFPESRLLRTDDRGVVTEEAGHTITDLRAVRGPNGELAGTGLRWTFDEIKLIAKHRHPELKDMDDGDYWAIYARTLEPGNRYVYDPLVRGETYLEDRNKEFNADFEKAKGAKQPCKASVIGKPITHRCRKPLS